jgi:hypothetical protein
MINTELRSDLCSNFYNLGNEMGYCDRGETFTDLKTGAPKVDLFHFRTRISE